jgi:small subunit ribosomal protein S8
MSMTDPIADFLTRIRNATKAGHSSVKIPRSKIKSELAKVLKNEGFIEGWVDVEEGFGSIKLFLRYDGNERGIIRGLQRISKPSRRVYVAKDSVPRVRNGLGLAILTTPKGVLSDKQARKAGVGGEVICYVW